MTYQSHVRTPMSVVVIFSDGDMKQIPIENILYHKVIGALDAGQYDAIPELVDMALLIKKHSSGKFYVVNGLIYMDGEILPDALSKRLLAFVNAGIDTSSLEKFWNNLKMNPSLRSRTMLYAFLENNGIPLTTDGCFVAYKRVTNDFKDCHTGTFDNSIGAEVWMDRSKVDPDPSVTCSRGLHVAAFPYAQGFYPNGKLVEVKVSPMDVVAVPDDYNGQKMRVCEYVVMRECEGPRPDAEVVYNYDSTADEDRWDDEDDIQVEDDWDGWDDEDEDGWDDEYGVDEDIDDVDAVAKTDVVVKEVGLDSRGRLCVPAAVIRKMGLSQYSLMYVTPNAKTLTLTVSKGERAYTVDKDMNVRITSYVLDLAGLGSRSSFRFTLVGPKEVTVS